MLHSPTPVNDADILFIESTYGDKDNPPGDPAAELERVVKETFEKQGVILIPAFAVGRTQLLLYYFHQLMEAGKIPDVPVYIDSPMATSATYLYYRYPKYHKVKFNQTEFARQLETNMLVFVKSGKHSKELNEIKKNAIIISSSGHDDRWPHSSSFISSATESTRHYRNCRLSGRRNTRQKIG